MSITRKSRNNRLTENRRCPVCERGMALVLNPYYGFRYCRWAEQGKCSNSEVAAMDEWEALRHTSERVPPLAPDPCSCPPGPCMGWVFDATNCRATVEHSGRQLQGGAT